MTDNIVNRMMFDASNLPLNNNNRVSAFSNNNHHVNEEFEEMSPKNQSIKSRTIIQSKLNKNKTLTMLLKNSQARKSTFAKSEKSEDFRLKPFKQSRRAALNAIAQTENTNLHIQEPSVSMAIPKRGKTNLFKYEEKNKKLETYLDKFKHLLRTYIGHNFELLLMSIFTIFCLFGPDFQQIYANKSFDNVFNGFYIFMIVIFLLEFLASIWVMPTYANSFFFWIDLCASLSMILEIDWILVQLVDFILMYNI